MRQADPVLWFGIVGRLLLISEKYLAESESVGEKELEMGLESTGLELERPTQTWARLSHGRHVNVHFVYTR